MTRYNVTYEIEAPDMNMALQKAHMLLFVANIDVENLQVKPTTTDPGQSFGDVIETTTLAGVTTTAEVDAEDSKPSFFDKVLGWHKP